MSGFLASVRDPKEALMALAAGADIIDLKAPEHGALGALSCQQVGAIVAAIDGRRPLSATVGDLETRPEILLPAVQRMAATGVDYVKLGFFPGGDWSASLKALAPCARHHRLIAVFFGDYPPQQDHIAQAADAGFSGIMLDTLDKGRGSLPEICPRPALENFTAAARARGLLCGLAGSLKVSDIPRLLELNPDYLGFRGALCVRHRRTQSLDSAAMEAVRRAIPPSNTASVSAGR